MTKETPRIFKWYVEQGFRAIRCKGYHSKYNKEKDYKTAKEPIDGRFTDNDFKGIPVEDAEKWCHDGGWMGWLIPKGYIAIDVEGDYKVSLVEDICQILGLKPLVHVTKNGKHFLFKSEDDLSGASSIFTACGLEVTYRVGGKNYLILAPVDGRRWENVKFK
jgi:hypothetical protein